MANVSQYLLKWYTPMVGTNAYQESVGIGVNRKGVCSNQTSLKPYPIPSCIPYHGVFPYPVVSSYHVVSPYHIVSLYAVVSSYPVIFRYQSYPHTMLHPVPCLYHPTGFLPFWSEQIPYFFHTKCSNFHTKICLKKHADIKFSGIVNNTCRPLPPPNQKYCHLHPPPLQYK